LSEHIQLGSAQKAAAVLVALGKERAAKLLEHFKQDEIRTLLMITRDLENIPQSLLEELVEEFEQEFLAGTGLMDSSSTMQSIIEEALTPEQLEELNKGEEATEIVLQTKSAWEILEEVDDNDLVDFLVSENQQVAAFILSKIPSNRSARIVGELEPGPRKQIVASMISPRKALPEAVEMLELLLKEKFGRSIGKDKGAGSRKLVAGIMNELNQEVSENLFSELVGAVTPETLQSVKSMMFRFPDVLSLEPAAQAALFDQVPTETTTLALQDASPELIEAVLGTLGQRTRRMVESELQNPSLAPSEQIKEAQKDIASLALSLAAEGTIVLPVEDLAA